MQPVCIAGSALAGNLGLSICRRIKMPLSDRLRWLVLVSLTVMACALASNTSASERPAMVQPFYPASPAAQTYDPDRYIPSHEAAIRLGEQTLSESDFVQIIPLNGEWKFSGLERSSTPFPEITDKSPEPSRTDFDDSHWEPIRVPSDFYLSYPPKTEEPYACGWYRTELEIPREAAGKRVILHFGVIGYKCVLYLNGTEVGRHRSEFTPWDVDITDFVTSGQKASLALCVFSDLGPGKFAGADKIITTADHAYGCQYSRRYDIKGGLWQSVELRIEPSIRVEHVYVDPDLSKSAINLRFTVINQTAAAKELCLVGSVMDADSQATEQSPAPSTILLRGAAAPGTQEYQASIPLENPKLWTPEAPNLYNLILTLMEGDTPIAVRSVRFGYRSFAANGDHFLLNGERIYLFGESIIVAQTFCVKDPEVDQPDVSPSARKKAAELLLGFKSRGSNALRLSEQPVVPAVLDIADEVGMLIYNMWAWSYNDKLSDDFETNNMAELQTWVKRDYNHPSVIMWLGGNEVKTDEKLAGIFSRQAQWIRSMDRSRRPVSVFSGAALGYAGSIKLDTDMLDLHSYFGLAGYPWTYFAKSIDNSYQKALDVYSNDGKTLGMPYVIWELVGYSWGRVYADYAPGDVDVYLSWAKKPFSWGSPNGIGWAGSIGLAAALDRNRGAAHGMETIGRRIMEYVRQDTRICGFAPWFLQASITLPSTSLWTQPVYCGMRGDSNEGGIPLRNAFSATRYSQDIFMVNSTNQRYADASCQVVLAECDGTETLIAEQSVISLEPWTKAIHRVEFELPSSGKPRWAQIRILVADSEKHEVSRNFYDVFIADPLLLNTPMDTASKIGVITRGTSVENPLTQILTDLKIKWSAVSDGDDLSEYQTLIVPPADARVEIDSMQLTAVQEWVKAGGCLLVLEQSYEGEFALLSKELTPVATVFADLVIPSHPLFEGLTQENFEFWSNPSWGKTASFVFSPIGSDLVVARGPLLDQKETYAVVCDSVSGKGRIIASQLEACKLWGVDSAASIYLINLLKLSMAHGAGK